MCLHVIFPLESLSWALKMYELKCEEKKRMKLLVPPCHIVGTQTMEGLQCELVGCVAL